MSNFSPAIASAISAGLGALTFRNKLRNLEEALSPERAGMLKKAGKIAAGVGAAGLAGAGGLYALGRGQADSGEGLGSTMKAGYSRIGDAISGEDKSTHRNYANVKAANEAKIAELKQQFKFVTLNWEDKNNNTRINDEINRLRLEIKHAKNLTRK